MALLRDWINLGKSTLTSVNAGDVAGLYAREWPETRNILIAEHRAAIEQEPKPVKRWIRTVSAVFFGLARRLAPHRRILFFLTQAAFFLCVVSIFARMHKPPFWIFAELVAAFLLITLLLGMELIDKIKIRDELALARDLQASLIPQTAPQTRHWDIAAFNHIANTVGGDIYDFVELPDGRVGVLFGDASGHGMAAGLVMAVAHAAFRTQLDIDATPGAIMTSLNRILCRTGGSRSFFACCYILLSPDGRFVATFAGHPAILHIGSDGHLVERIGRGAYPLGVKSDLQWAAVEGTLAAGERLVLHSDGLSESRNEHDDEFGEAYIETVAGWHPAASARTVVDDLASEWRIFTAGTVIEDDVSIAVIRRL